jgi:hypothetical protein
MQLPQALVPWFSLALVPAICLAFARVYAGLFLRENDDTCIPAKLAGVCVHSVHYATSFSFSIPRIMSN